MHVLRACFFLLLTPSGRANQAAFMVGGVITRLTATFAGQQAFCAVDDDPVGLWAMLALFAVWMSFCLYSRRLHDCGKSNMMMVPLLLAEVLLLLSLFDRRWIEVSEDPIESAGMLWAAAKTISIIYGPLGMFLLRADSDSGDNAYGPPFGEAPREIIPISKGSNLQSTHKVAGQSKIERRLPNLNREAEGGRRENPGGGLPPRPPRMQPTGPKRFGGR